MQRGIYVLTILSNYKLQEWQGLDIREVAHDCSATVSNYITEDLGLINSFDTWHGMCSIAIIGVCSNVKI